MRPFQHKQPRSQRLETPGTACLVPRGQAGFPRGTLPTRSIICAALLHPSSPFSAQPQLRTDGQTWLPLRKLKPPQLLKAWGLCSGRDLRVFSSPHTKSLWFCCSSSTSAAVRAVNSQLLTLGVTTTETSEQGYPQSDQAGTHGQLPSHLLHGRRKHTPDSRRDPTGAFEMKPTSQAN